MELTVLSSSSAANGYILKSSKGEVLIIEAGVKLAEVKKVLGFKTSGIKGCISSHRHGDHAKYVHDYTRNGINVYGPVDIFILPHHRNRPAQPGKGFTAGGFKVLPFEVAHDVTCFGYLVEHEEMGRLVFMTDTFMSEYTFKGVNHWLVEANYSDEVLEEAIMEGSTHAGVKGRLLQTHMELSTLVNMLKANDMKAARNIVLMHLSDRHSNAEAFVRRLQEETGKPVYVADKGLTIDLSL